MENCAGFAYDTSVRVLVSSYGCVLQGFCRASASNFCCVVCSLVFSATAPVVLCLSSWQILAQSSHNVHGANLILVEFLLLHGCMVLLCREKKIQRFCSERKDLVEWSVSAIPNARFTLPFSFTIECVFCGECVGKLCPKEESAKEAVRPVSLCSHALAYRIKSKQSRTTLFCSCPLHKCVLRFWEYNS